MALLHVEMHRLASEPRRIRLFFNYWARGFRHPLIRIDGYLTAARGQFAPQPL